MIIDTIKTGDRVDITYTYMPKDTKTYHSTVETVIKRKQIIIYAPISSGAVVRLPKEEQYILRFISEKGIYRFKAKIVDYIKDDGLPMVLFKVLDEGERIQLRNFFRVLCSINTTFSVVEEVEDGSPQPRYEGLIRDLGGGGMKMISKHYMEEGTMITVILELDDEQLLIFGEIRHMVHNIGATIPYQYGIKFTALSKIDQEKIVRYLTNEQRKLLQRAR